MREEFPGGNRQPSAPPAPGLRLPVQLQADGAGQGEPGPALRPPLLPAVPGHNASSTCFPQAELISWSKGFQCSDVEGKDVVQLLQAAISKQEVGAGWGVLAGWAAPRRGADGATLSGQLHHVDVVALLNNTVGTMMTCSTPEKPCEIALVVGEQWGWGL